MSKKTNLESKPLKSILSRFEMNVDIFLRSVEVT